MSTGCCTASTPAAPTPACSNSTASPPRSRPGGQRSSRSCTPASPTPAQKAPTASSRPSPAKPTDSATPRTNASAPAPPPPAATADTSTPPNFEEPVCVEIPGKIADQLNDRPELDEAERHALQRRRTVRQGLQPARHRTARRAPGAAGRCGNAGHRPGIPSRAQGVPDLRRPAQQRRRATELSTPGHGWPRARHDPGVVVGYIKLHTAGDADGTSCLLSGYRIVV